METHAVPKEPETYRIEKNTILAIDDMPDILETIRSFLKDKYNVFCMTGYESSIKFLKSNTVDLILLDIEMPGLDGFTMMQMFRRLPRCSDTPVVFLTGSVSDENIRMAASLGARGFIKKPVELPILINKLETVLL